MHVRLTHRGPVARAAFSLLGGTCLVLGCAGVASARPATKAHSQTSAAKATVAGTYAYSDSFGDSAEGLTIDANGTLAFDSGCSGLWTQSGKAITMDINADCGNSTWIFSGTVTAKGLSSQAKPGATVEDQSGNSLGTWFAVKSGTVGTSSGPLATHNDPTGHDAAKAPLGGTFSFTDSGGSDTSIPLTLNTGGTVALTTQGLNCTGLWVKVKKTIAWDLNTPTCNLVVFSGSVTKTGLSSLTKPGSGNFSGATGTWYAPKP
jgi:hypothetical protein